jgi:uncharacterized protein (TIGR02145 family)
MTNDSITKKLSELFELHKSGTITKEEFDKLKHQTLSENETEKTESKMEEQKIKSKSSKKPNSIKRNLFLLAILFLVVACTIVFLILPKTQTDKTVKIGEQTWMAENLNVGTFRNGDLIPQAKTDAEWLRASEQGEPAWCYYDNASKNGKIYGKLYNWYAVNDARGLAPKGWHVPSDEEWTTLADYLGGEDIAGGKLKERNTKHWLIPNEGATNESGFTALPGGYRNFNGTYFFNSTYFSIGSHGFWWSSSESAPSTAYGQYMYYYSSAVSRLYNFKTYGFSVRCVLD